MSEPLRDSVERLFVDAPQTRRARELREEFYNNLAEKYEDLVAGGLSEEAAVEKILKNIGDVGELIESLEEENLKDNEENIAQRKKNALIVTASVVLYIVSVIAIIVLQSFHIRAEIILCIFLGLAAIPTAALIYNALSQPRYRRADDTLVEEFKEFTQTASQNRAAWKSLVGAYWCLVTALYFFISFFFGAWIWSWIIFILAAGVQGIIKAALELRR